MLLIGKVLDMFINVCGTCNNSSFIETKITLTGYKAFLL